MLNVVDTHLRDPNVSFRCNQMMMSVQNPNPVGSFNYLFVYAVWKNLTSDLRQDQPMHL